jgi:sulfite dehydrogenase (cytochrome) subunit B
MKRVFIIVGIPLLLLLSIARAADEPPKSITLPQVESPLPDAPGKELVAGACLICHSNRYITMQPAFGRAVWQAEVDKMRKAFGAPIAEEVAPKIVDYLVAVRGAPGGTPKEATGDQQKK